MNIQIKQILLKPINNKRLASLCGPLDENISFLENQLQIIINRYNNLFIIKGSSSNINIAIDTLVSLYSYTKNKFNKIKHIDVEQILEIMNTIQTVKQQIKPFQKNSELTQSKIILKNKIIIPRTLRQAQYINNIFKHDITFGIGPSGTGKTYLAVAAAIDLIERKKNQRLILSRPAIESGEKLGFLPGNFTQKTDPYIQPLYDALDLVIGYKQLDQLIQNNIIEVIPLAYMRGRTLKNSIIILDESQNATITQMKMFLTRIGFNSTAIITGDITQVDLPNYQESGLSHAIKILSKIKEISFNFFDSTDSVRHNIITQIINAYET